MTVDSYRYLPRSFVPLYEAVPELDEPPVWTGLPVELTKARVALLSSAGMFLPAEQQGFDVERERREPTWGDPTYRAIPSDVRQDEIDAVHLHINTDVLRADSNVALPLRPFARLAEQGRIGSLSHEHFSLMGFQEEGAEVWRTEVGPEIAARCHEAEIHALVLAPA
ncbi:MAG: glycine/sarcosine/betaine reductase selenoprotein B family protein [Acidimicrobiia bacterium]